MSTTTSPRPFPVVTVTVAAVAYALVATLALALEPPAKGWAVLACSVGGCVALVVVARQAGRSDWLAALGVLIPISIFQVLPDWFLADGLGTLHFPDTGAVRVGGVIPLAMAGMWAIPLFVVYLAAHGSAARGAVVAFLFFLATELLAPAVDLWGPAGGVREILGVAVYVLPAEAVLGAATVIAVRETAQRSFGVRILAALAVSTLYTGALALCWFLIDHADLTLSAS